MNVARLVSYLLVGINLAVGSALANPAADAAHLPSDFDQCSAYFPNNKAARRAAHRGEQELCYDGYASLYSYSLKRLVYVSAYIDAKALMASVERNGNRKSLEFFADTRINPNFVAHPADFLGSARDRGHAIGNSMSTSLAFQEQSFSTANVCAQAPQPNRQGGAWNVLEKSFRAFIKRTGENAWFTAGCMGDIGKIKNGIVVPQAYWMLITPVDPKRAPWAFIVDNVDGARITDKLTQAQLEAQIGYKLGGNTN